MKNNPFAIAQKYLEVKKNPEGEEAKRMIETQEDLTPIAAWVVEEIRDENAELRAVRVSSAFWEDNFWMIFDRSYEPKDNLAIYYENEIPLLKGKSLEDLKLIHQTKLIFPGARVVQD